MLKKSNQPLITVGIPFYNSEKYIKDAINSVLNQTFKNWELILLDDGSTDNSLEIAKTYDGIDRRVSIISDGKNLGLPSRLNELTRLANGKYYCRMDADDIMHPERLLIQYTYLTENPIIDLCGSSLITIDNNNRIIGIRGNSFQNSFTLKQMLTGTWCVHPTIMGKTEWFLRYPYDELLKRGQDYDLWIRTVEKSQFVRLKAPYLFYREASTSSLIKYIYSTKYSLVTYWQHKNKIGLINYFILVIKKCFKLIIYFLLAIFGKTDFLIKRRSAKLNENDIKHYNEVLIKAKIFNNN